MKCEHGVSVEACADCAPCDTLEDTIRQIFEATDGKPRPNVIEADSVEVAVLKSLTGVVEPCLFCGCDEVHIFDCYMTDLDGPRKQVVNAVNALNEKIKHLTGAVNVLTERLEVVEGKRSENTCPYCSAMELE